MIAPQISNVFTSFKPLFNYLKFFGLFLPSFHKDIHFGTFEVKLRDKVWSLTSTFCICCSIYYFIGCQTTYWNNSLILLNAYYICALFGNLVSLLMVVYQWKNSKKILKILYKLHEFDLKVKNIFFSNFQTLLQFLIFISLKG